MFKRTKDDQIAIAVHLNVFAIQSVVSFELDQTGFFKVETFKVNIYITYIALVTIVTDLIL
jgi:hypothetical protein